MRATHHFINLVQFGLSIPLIQHVTWRHGQSLPTISSSRRNQQLAHATHTGDLLVYVNIGLSIKTNQDQRIIGQNRRVDSPGPTAVLMRFIYHIHQRTLSIWYHISTTKSQPASRTTRQQGFSDIQNENDRKIVKTA